MAAGNAADRIGHGQDRQAEGEGTPSKADAEFGKGRRQHRAAATAEDEPECAEKFREETFWT